ncbi:MAG: hypothetical protein PHU91_02810 [Candidatus Omnitrophica bacterium]|nr:hypothetical protein [Candidatus Omnitrophota bacterium]MDD5236575.1 hypothetical protein [Candidatus Omnitrophota bacterium]MDD5610355.1 hypothetical protein [Candidatus Omnitrophota bacterium]
MFLDNNFKIALLVSLGIHGIALGIFPIFRSPYLRKNFDKKIEVSYIKAKPGLTLKRSEGQKNNMNSLKLPPPTYTKREEIAKENLLKVNKPEVKISGQDSALIRTRISIPPVSSKEIRNPGYISYYQIIREKIKRAAYRMYSKKETGEIYLSFAVDSGGALEGVRLIEEKSAQNQYLREIALRSIQVASPFPRFPKELDYPQLSFNIIISFEAEK